MSATSRMLQYIEYKGISKYKFCKETGFSNGILDKNRNLGSDKCRIISEVYNDISIEWLITGTGSMLRNSNVQKTEQTPVNTNVSVVQDTKCKQQIQLLQQENTFLKENNNQLKENITLLKESKALIEKENARLTTENKQLRQSLQSKQTVPKKGTEFQKT